MFRLQKKDLFECVTVLLLPKDNYDVEYSKPIFTVSLQRQLCTFTEEYTDSDAMINNSSQISLSNGILRDHLFNY